VESLGSDTLVGFELVLVSLEGDNICVHRCRHGKHSCYRMCTHTHTHTHTHTNADKHTHTHKHIHSPAVAYLVFPIMFIVSWLYYRELR